MASREQDQPVDSALVDRDVAPVTFPNKIYALGGAGKQMAFQLFDQDWFLTEAARPDGVNDTVDVHVLDTATERAEQERERADRITERAERIASQLRIRDPNGTVREVSVDPVYLTENVYNNQVADFIGGQTIEQIRRNTSVDHWWLTEEHLTDPNSPGDMFNFAKGVIRRRALGKALFFKALSEDTTRMRTVFDLGGSDGPPDVAVLAGLGGGTGSGQAIDVARYLRRHNQDARITLFATMPTPREGSNERANAYAALSELEYLALPDTPVSNPFNDVVLFPLTPTDHRGGETTVQDLLEFDEAFGYALLSYYNNPDVDHPFEGVNAFAPFTIAVPQVLRYSVQELHRAREIGHDLLEQKRRVLDAQRAIFTDVIEFLRDQYPDRDPGGPDALNQTDVDKLVYALRDFESLVESPIFEQLEYDAVTVGREILTGIYGDEDPGEQDVRAIVEAEGVDGIVDAVEFELEGRDHEPGHLTEFEDIDDESLRRVVVEDLHHVRLLYDLLRERKRIPADSDAVDRLLETFLDPEAERTVIRERWGKLNALLEDTEETVADLEARVQELDGEIEDARDQRRDRVESVYGDWYAEVESDLDLLIELADIDPEPVFDRLTDRLEALAAEVQRKPPEQVDVDVADALNEVQDTLAGIDPLDAHFAGEADEIKSAARSVVAAREHWDAIAVAESGGGLLPFGGSETASTEREQYHAVRTELEQSGVFRVSYLPSDLADETFTVEAVYDPGDDGRIRDELRTRRRRATDRVLTAFGDAVGDLSGDHASSEREELRSVLEDLDSHGSPRTAVEDVVKGAIRPRLGGDLADLEAEREDVQAELARERDALETLSAVKDLQQTCRRHHEEYAEAYDQFRAALEEGRRAVESKPPVGKRLTADFIHRVDPRHKTGAKTSTSLRASKILAEEDDRRNAVDTIAKMLKTRVVKKQYNSLVNASLSTDGDQAGTFGRTYVSVGVLTEAFDESGAADNCLTADHFPIEENVDIRTARNDGFKTWHVRNGGPWDVAITAFIQGISFLDNVNDVFHGQYAYRNAYESKRSGSEPTLLRHALELENGYYVYRDGFMNLNDDRDRSHLVTADTDAEVADRIRTLQRRVAIADDTDGDATDNGRTDDAGASDVPAETDAGAPLRDDSDARRDSEW